VSLPEIHKQQEVRDLVFRALAEDIGPGDVTSAALVAEQETVRGVVLSRGDYILSGIHVSALVFQTLDESLTVEVLSKDGSSVREAQEVLRISGNARSILAAERVALNLLQRMTGIASQTRRYAERSGHAAILDTRKTTPGLRVLEKYAVLCGGGMNHRTGLYDRVLIKDNHRALWRRRGTGTLADAVRAAKKMHPELLVEVEVETEEDLASVLSASPDWVLLDNMSPARMAQCVVLCKGKCKVEASGGITLENVEAVAGSGVDAISIGALTHSVRAADFSLEFPDLSP
jgi:nicotinate-nucleotide pyrophosphorylase (carboxylating)